MEVYLNNLQAKFDYHNLYQILRSWHPFCLLRQWFQLSILRNNVPSLTQFSVEVHLDNLQVKYYYSDLDLIFKIMEAILIVVEMVSIQYLEK